MIRLAQSDIKPLRDKLLKQQNYICPLCEHKIKNPALDHNHTTGKVRMVLCRECNRILGKIESNYHRYGMTDQQLKIMSPKVYDYLQIQTEYIHPTFKIKTVKLGKRDYNKLMKYWNQLYPKRKKPEYPKSGNLTKEFETYMEKLNATININQN